MAPALLLRGRDWPLGLFWGAENSSALVDVECFTACLDSRDLARRLSIDAEPDAPIVGKAGLHLLLFSRSQYGLAAFCDLTIVANHGDVRGGVVLDCDFPMRLVGILGGLFAPDGMRRSKLPMVEGSHTNAIISAVGQHEHVSGP